MTVQKYYIKKKKIISKLQQNLHAGRSTVTDRVAPFSFQTSERCVEIPTACVWNSLSLNHYNT